MDSDVRIGIDLPTWAEAMLDRERPSRISQAPAYLALLCKGVRSSDSPESYACRLNRFTSRPLAAAILFGVENGYLQPGVVHHYLCHFAFTPKFIAVFNVLRDFGEV